MVVAVRLLRRKSDRVDEDGVDDGAGDATPTGTDAEQAETGAARTPGKGRPTPKRRDAESKRRGPAPPPPRNQREAIKLSRKNRASRDERRKASAERRAKMMAGDESALMPRDRGPVRAFTRDMVDSRRHVMGLFMPLAGLVFLSILLPASPIQAYINLFGIAMVLAMTMEAALLGQQITKRARERFPNANVKALGVTWYAFTRGSQIRKMRVPKPRVGYGAEV